MAKVHVSLVSVKDKFEHLSQQSASNCPPTVSTDDDGGKCVVIVLAGNGKVPLTAESILSIVSR